MPETDEKRINWFLWLIGVSCTAAIVASFYSYYFQKNYNFIVEVSCDPALENCFQRDCSEEDSCPPNELSIFKRFYLTAHDYKFCTNEDCAEACGSGQIKCEPIECTEDITTGETCSSYDLEEEIGTE